MNHRRYGYIKDAPGKSDDAQKALFKRAGRGYTLPKRMNLIEKFGLFFSKYHKPYSQGRIGSCTANALAFAYVFREMKQQTKITFMPSRMFIYYNERELENSLGFDNGAQISTGINVLKNFGVCPEAMWPYDCDNYNNKPPESCFHEASNCKLTNYQKIPYEKHMSKQYVLEQLKSAIVNDCPIVFGFSAYENLESVEVEKTGILRLPLQTEQFLGGHAVVAVGYDDEFNCYTANDVEHPESYAGAFLIRNSWGPEWGCVPMGEYDEKNRGYFWLPYNYALGVDENNNPLCADFWLIGLVGNPEPNLFSIQMTDIEKTVEPCVISLESSINDA